MVTSQLNRIILLALLPVIAFVLFIEGQKYDPALIRFNSSEPGIGTEVSFFPSEIDGYSRAGQVRIFNRDNLYEYVNGHAEYFISAGFAGLAVGEYVKTGAEPGQPDAVVDVYNMGKDIQAFGILADEAGENPDSVRVGSMGFKTEQGLNFIKGKYYVKINVFSDNVPVDTIAEQIDRKIGPATETFTVFSRLPDLGKIISTRFIKEAYRGLDFVNNVIEREYIVNGNNVQVFLVTGSQDDVSKLVLSFMDFFRRSEIKYNKIDKENRTIYKVNDPYEGDWYILPSHDALFGIFGAEDENILKHIVQNTENP